MRLLQLTLFVSGMATIPACTTEAIDSDQGRAATARSELKGNSAAEKVGRLLAFNPGSRQVAANAVELDEGVTVIVPSDSDNPVRVNSASGRCRGGNLCLFEHSDFRGSILQLSGCRDVSLSDFNMDNGLPWKDQASSIDNPLPRPGPARFFNNGNFMLALEGDHFLRNLASDSSADGGNANDKIDTVRTCP